MLSTHIHPSTAFPLIPSLPIFLLLVGDFTVSGDLHGAPSWVSGQLSMCFTESCNWPIPGPSHWIPLFSKKFQTRTSKVIQFLIYFFFWIKFYWHTELRTGLCILYAGIQYTVTSWVIATVTISLKKKIIKYVWPCPPNAETCCGPQTFWVGGAWILGTILSVEPPPPPGASAQCTFNIQRTMEWTKNAQECRENPGPEGKWKAHIPPTQRAVRGKGILKSQTSPLNALQENYIKMFFQELGCSTEVQKALNIYKARGALPSTQTFDLTYNHCAALRLLKSELRLGLAWIWGNPYIYIYIYQTNSIVISSVLN